MMGFAGEDKLASHVYRDSQNTFYAIFERMKARQIDGRLALPM